MNTKFLNFVNDLVDDIDLRNVIIESYCIIYESKLDVAKDVYREYNKILDNIEDFDRVGNLYSLKSEINGIQYTTYVTFNNMRDSFGAVANFDPMTLMIYSFELHLLFKQNNIIAVKQYFNTPYVRYTIAHELSHLYEYTKRDKDELLNQLNKTDGLDFRKTKSIYDNQPVEQTPIRIGSIVSMVKDAINNKITDPNKIYSYIIKNMDSYTDNTYDNLNEKNKKQLHQTISNVLHEICIDDKCDLNGFNQ